MLLDDLNWMNVERYLQSDDRVILITGTCEQHGYLSLMTDIRVPLVIAQEAARREGVLIAPPLAYGISPYFTTYPGTLSLRPETFLAVMRELIADLVAQGFRRILVNNGHGGNTSVLTLLLTELGGTYPQVHFGYYQWWTDPAVLAVAQAAGLVPQHANWLENFPFTRVGPVPEGEKPVVTLPAGASAATTRAQLGDGSYGGPYQAPDEVMERLLAAAVESVVAALQAL